MPCISFLAAVALNKFLAKFLKLMAAGYFLQSEQKLGKNLVLHLLVYHCLSKHVQENIFRSRDNFSGHVMRNEQSQFQNSDGRFTTLVILNNIFALLCSTFLFFPQGSSCNYTKILIGIQYGCSLVFIDFFCNKWHVCPPS